MYNLHRYVSTGNDPVHGQGIKNPWDEIEQIVFRARFLERWLSLTQDYAKF